MSSSLSRALNAIPECPSCETIKPVLAKLHPTWKIPERLHQSSVVKSMVQQGWVITKYQLLEKDFCEVLFEHGHPDCAGLTMVKGVYIDPVT